MMKKTTNLKTLALSLVTMGILFTSCEKEETLEIDESAKENLEEPPFSNYLVISQSGKMTKSAEDFLKIKGTNVLHQIPEIGISVVSSADPDFTTKAKGNMDISIVPDYEIKWIPSDGGKDATPSIGSTEPYYFYDYLWGLEAIDAPDAWNAGFTGEGSNVFVLDSGIDAEHIDLAPNLNTELSASFITGEDWNVTDGDPFNHGTHVAGTIAAAQNGAGVIGVAPHTELIAIKVLSEFSGSGPFSSINSGIVYAANNDADVINMSLGATFEKNGTITDADGSTYKIPAVYIQEIIKAQQRAIDYAFKKGSTIIVSAGNDGVDYDGNKSFIKLPGGLNNVITVSATAPDGYDWQSDSNDFDVPASYTTYGRSLVDVAAPGGDYDVATEDMILSTANGGGYYWSAGTSMAAPHVSGVAALIIAKNGGEMDPHEVAKQIENTSDKIDGNGKNPFYGAGRINALRAVTE